MTAELNEFNSTLAESRALRYPIAIVDQQIFQSRVYSYSPLISDFELAKRAKHIGKQVKIIYHAKAN